MVLKNGIFNLFICDFLIDKINGKVIGNSIRVSKNIRGSSG